MFSVNLKERVALTNPTNPMSLLLEAKLEVILEVEAHPLLTTDTIIIMALIVATIMAIILDIAVPQISEEEDDPTMALAVNLTLAPISASPELLPEAPIEMLRTDAINVMS